MNNIQDFLKKLIEATEAKVIKWKQHTSVTTGAYASTEANGRTFQIQVTMNDSKEITCDIFEMHPQGNYTALAHIKEASIDLYNAAIASVEEGLDAILPDLFKSLKPKKVEKNLAKHAEMTPKSE